jgi:uncharacterized membrane protein YuzA (DUF378 family)
MKELMTKKNLIYLGIGLIGAIVIYNVLKNRTKESEKTKNDTNSESENSSFCGCGA